MSKLHDVKVGGCFWRSPGTNWSKKQGWTQVVFSYEPDWNPKCESRPDDALLNFDTEPQAAQEIYDTILKLKNK